jgi:hypothetical protein
MYHTEIVAADRIRFVIGLWARSRHGRSCNSLGAEHWAVFDEVFPGVRAAPAQETLVFLQSNAVIFACGLYRRFEMIASVMVARTHRLVCDICTPGPARKKELWEEMAGLPEYELSFFQKRLVQLFDTEEKRGSRLCSETVRVREDIRKGHTMRTEGSNAQQNKLLGSQKKAIGLAQFSTTSFCRAVRALHVWHGGNPKWAGLTNQELGRSLDAESNARPTVQNAGQHAPGLPGSSNGGAGGQAVAAEQRRPSQLRKRRRRRRRSQSRGSTQ